MGKKEEKQNQLTATDNEQPLKDAPQKCEYYNVTRMCGRYIGWIVLAFLVCAFVVPWIIGIIYHSLIGWSGKGNPCLNWFFSGLLPDFMGGMVGLFIGFIVEWWLVSKLRIISKYDSIKVPLKECLTGIKSTADLFKTYLIGSKNGEQIPNEKRIRLCSSAFESFFISNLVDDLDDYSILCHLPNKTPFHKPFNSNLADLLYKLHKNIKEYESFRRALYNGCLAEFEKTIDKKPQNLYNIKL